MIWNHSHEGERCDTCDDSGLAQVRGLEIVGDLVYELGCAPCPDCERGQRRRAFDLTGIVNEGQEHPPRDWKQRRWPKREPDEFIRTSADHMAHDELVFRKAQELAAERRRTDAENFVGAEPPPAG